MNSACDVPGTQGYAEHADALVARWERIAFAECHEAVIDRLPMRASRILDVGAGSGRDAAALAAMGHDVVAVEPVDALRIAAQRLHACERVTWMDDSLPDLRAVLATRVTFDVIMLTAVWMHLDEAERRRAMSVLSGLLNVDGLLAISLRHGPVPPGRRMFDVSASDTIALAHDCGLKTLLSREAQSVQPSNRANHVLWSRLVFTRAACAPA